MADERQTSAGADRLVDFRPGHGGSHEPAGTGAGDGIRPVGAPSGGARPKPDKDASSGNDQPRPAGARPKADKGAPSGSAQPRTGGARPKADKGAPSGSAQPRTGGARPKPGPKVGVAPAPSPSEGMGSVKKSVFFLVLVALAYFLYLVFSGELGTFVASLAGANYGWIAVAALCYVVYYLLGVTAYAIAVAGDAKSPLGILDLMSVEATGIFFSNLTPNGTGGAPAQILRLMRSGLSVGAAGALQYTRFIIYEAAEGIFAALMLIPRLGYFLDAYGNVFLVGALLFGAKVAEVTGLLLVCLLPRQVSAVGNWVLRLIHRWGWIKDERFKSWSHTVNVQVYEFSNGFKAGARNVRLMALTMVVSLVQLGFQYALPWVVLQAFGKQGDFLTCLACGSMLELLTSAIPLPGGTLGAEGGFAFLFGSMYGETLSAGYVVWRMVEYVLPVLVSVPLMGLRTRNGLSLNARLRRWRARR